MKEEVDRGGRIEKGLGKEREDGFVVESETATDMVCMRLVSLKVAVDFWPLVKVRFTSFTSALTSLSMEFLLWKESREEAEFGYG